LEIPAVCQEIELEEEKTLDSRISIEFGNDPSNNISFAFLKFLI
jgi:hypothetical protein